MPRARASAVKSAMKRERLRNHEAAGAGFLHRMADGVEPDRRDAGGVKAIEDAER